MKEAMLYDKQADNRVQCHLCAHGCAIADDKRGVCQVRENRDGTLYTLVYGRTIAQHVAAGGHFHAGGMLLFGEDLDWGRKIYRTMDTTERGDG